MTRSAGALRAVEAPVSGEAWVDALRAAVRPEFQVVLYTPPSGTALAGAGCLVEGCQKVGHIRPLGDAPPRSLCGAHGRRWRLAGRPRELEAWAAEQDPLFTFKAVVACQAPGCRRAAASARTGLCDWHARQWRAAGKPRIEEFVADAPPAPTRGRICAFPGCVFPTMRDGSLCDGHMNKFLGFRHHHGGDPSIAHFVRHVIAQHTKLVKHFDLTGLPPALTLELQFTLQCRQDESGATFTKARWTALTERLRAHDVRSLLDHEERFWARVDPSWRLGNRQFGYVRYAIKVLTRLRDQALGADPWRPDVWDVRGLPLGDAYVHQRTSWLDWTAIDPPWLRAVVKRWARHRLLSGRSPNSIRGACASLAHFSRFLRENAIDLREPVSVDRSLLERFHAHVQRLALSISYRRAILADLNCVLNDARRLGWAAFPPAACYLPGELPRLKQSLPRALEPALMAQIESDEALARIANPTLRTAVVLLIETGLRSIDACRLAYEPLTMGTDGAPYLRFHNHKLRREAVIPVSDRVVAAVRAQQQHVTRTWPGIDSAWLLPRIRSNPLAEYPLGYASLHRSLGRWVAGLELRNASGTSVSVTAHRFRHTLATRMINEGVPLDAIRRYLDHSSEQMTMRYARLHDTELRRHWERWQHTRVNIAGEVIPQELDTLRDAAWTKETLGRARQALPNGYCGLPMQQSCPHPNACLTCGSFLTDATHLDTHRAHLSRVEQMIATATERGWQRVVDNNERDRISLINIIDGIERLPDDRPDEDGEAHAA